MSQYTPEQLILTRLLKELKETQRLALGRGIPQLLRPHLPEGKTVYDLQRETQGSVVDVSIVESKEVSARGDLVATDPGIRNLTADRWIVILKREDTQPYNLVEVCTAAVDCRECVDLIVTELGVILIGDCGFELQEIAPGCSSDDIRNLMQASLHVADDLKVMEL